MTNYSADIDQFYEQMSVQQPYTALLRRQTLYNRSVAEDAYEQLFLTAAHRYGQGTLQVRELFDQLTHQYQLRVVYDDLHVFSMFNNVLNNLLFNMIGHRTVDNSVQFYISWATKQHTCGQTI